MRKAIKILAVTTLALTLALPITAYASQWQQDSTGWKVLQDNGTYLTNQWYQNTDGKWYYIGADGYMLTSTTTPDGYPVDYNGVWIPTDSTETSRNQNNPINPDTTSNNVANEVNTDVNNPVDRYENGEYKSPYDSDPADYPDADWGGLGKSQDHWNSH